MKQSASVVLLATFVSAGAWASDFNAYSTTMIQLSKQTTPGFDTAHLAPATEFLGIDATKLGSDALSLHLFGWGFKDLGDPSTPYGKSGGDLSYAYLEYRFSQANAMVKAGRFTVNQGGGVEQVDGVSGRTDLRGGFNVSGFFGAPVRYRTAEPQDQTAYNKQSDLIYGARLGLRTGPMGEVGVSYLQEGSQSPKPSTAPQPAAGTHRAFPVQCRNLLPGARKPAGQPVAGGRARLPGQLPVHPRGQAGRQLHRAQPGRLFRRQQPAQPVQAERAGQAQGHGRRAHPGGQRQAA